MAVDKKRFASDLAYIGEWQGGRVADAKVSKQPDVVAAAITLSTLVNLRSLAGLKALTPADLQVVIDGFDKTCGMEEYEGNMGGVMYRRKK